MDQERPEGIAPGWAGTARAVELSGDTGQSAAVPRARAGNLSGRWLEHRSAPRLEGEERQQ